MGWGGVGGCLYGRSHTLTDIIVIDQSHRYVYVTSGASDQPGPPTPAAYGCVRVRVRARARASLLLSLGGWDRRWTLLCPSGCPAEAAVHDKTASSLFEIIKKHFGLVPVDLPVSL